MPVSLPAIWDEAFAGPVLQALQTGWYVMKLKAESCSIEREQYDTL